MTDVKSRVEAAIGRVGEQVCLLRPEGPVYLTASLQPLLPGTDETSDPLGVGDAGRFVLYACCGQERIEVGDTVECRGARYHVLQAASFFVAGEEIYRRAVLRPVSGEGGTL